MDALRKSALEKPGVASSGTLTVMRAVRTWRYSLRSLLCRQVQQPADIRYRKTSGCAALCSHDEGGHHGLF